MLDLFFWGRALASTKTRACLWIPDQKTFLWVLRFLEWLRYGKKCTLLWYCLSSGACAWRPDFNNFQATLGHSAWAITYLEQYLLYSSCAAPACPSPMMSRQANAHAHGAEPRPMSMRLHDCLQDCVNDVNCKAVDWKWVNSKAAGSVTIAHFPHC